MAFLAGESVWFAEKGRGGAGNPTVMDLGESACVPELLVAAAGYGRRLSPSMFIPEYG
jgi:hypothetical protein